MSGCMEIPADTNGSGEKRLMKKICHMSSIRDSRDLCMFQREALLAFKAGYEVIVVAKGDSQIEEGVQVVGVGTPPKSRLKRMLFFTHKIYRAALTENANLYLIHDPELLPYALKLKRHGKKVVFDSHELYALLLRTKEYLPCANLVAGVYAFFERYAVRQLDAVILPATVQGKDPFFSVSKRTVFVANYSALGEMFKSYEAREDSQPTKLCFVGCMTPDRGIENMIMAAEKTKLPLLLVGDFTPKEYEDKVRSLSGWKYVDFRGRLDRQSVAAVYQEATIGLCVMPNGGQYNVSDTFNMKVYDYMAMGLPVILSDSAYARKVNAKYHFARIVDPTDIDAIADAAEYLATHPREAVRMGETGRQAVIMEYNWECESKKLLALYEELIGPA